MQEKQKQNGSCHFFPILLRRKFAIKATTRSAIIQIIKSINRKIPKAVKINKSTTAIPTTIFFLFRTLSESNAFTDILINSDVIMQRS